MALQLMLYRTEVYGATDTGLVRHNNEDCWHQLDDYHFYSLADGMGGHQAGEIASREAVKNIGHFVTENLLSDKSLHDARELLSDGIRWVNDLVYRMGHRSCELKGMGTTLCCLFLHPKGLIYAHVGDSRIYRMRKGQLELLTHDHSLVRELIDLGQLNESEAEAFQYKNILTKAIGIEPKIEPTVQSDSLQKGDILMMCTDGLTDLLADQEIEQVMKTEPENEMANSLVKKAIAKGGFDNVTVVIVKIQDQNASTDLP